MGNGTNVSSAKFAAVLEVNSVRYQCVGVSMSFAINRIPSASCSLATGRDVVSLEQAAIHANADQLKMLLPARIIFTPQGEWSPDDGVGANRWFAAGEQVIFEGYLAGFSYQRVLGSLSPVVSLAHWLSDLSFSSALSNQSHPANPYQFNWRAFRGSQADGGNNNTQAQNNFIGSYTALPLFTADNITEDLWAKSLHPFFGVLSEQDILSDFGLSSCNALDRANVDAQKALRRLETHKEAKDVVGTDYKIGGGSPYHKPLQFRLSGASGQIKDDIAEAIAVMVRDDTENEWFSSTTWDLLVGKLGPLMGFHVVPRVQTAQLVPFLPGLRKTFSDEYNNGKMLDLRDMDSIEPSVNIIRPIRAVGMLQTSPNMTDPLTGQPLLSLGGCFSPDKDGVGMVLYRRPPRWLDTVPQIDNNMQFTAMSDIPSSSTTPKKPAQSQDKNSSDPNDVVNQLEDYYTRAAQQAYCEEMLRGRGAVISGKLRFDLAPGTTVNIKNRQPLFLNDDKLTGDLVGTISRVGIMIHAEGAQASTSFQVDYVRTKGENEDDRTSIAEHPLYEGVYTGAPLVHEYLFPEKS